MTRFFRVHANLWVGAPCDHKHCDSSDMFLIFHLTSPKYMFKGNTNLWAEPHHETLSCLLATGRA